MVESTWLRVRSQVSDHSHSTWCLWVVRTECLPGTLMPVGELSVKLSPLLRAVREILFEYLYLLLCSAINSSHHLFLSHSVFCHFSSSFYSSFSSQNYSAFYHSVYCLPSQWSWWDCHMAASSSAKWNDSVLQHSYITCGWNRERVCGDRGHWNNIWLFSTGVKRGSL